MSEQLRNFEVADPFGRKWQVEFRWLQNAISIRHADAIDLKYYVSDGRQRRELVVALPHAALLKLASERGRELTDAWCLHLGASHVRQSISSGSGLESALVTLDEATLARLNDELEAASARQRELAGRAR